MSPDAAAEVVEELDRAGPASACGTPHTRFAVLSTQVRAERALVELDGCHRLLRPNNTLGRLDDATIATLSHG